MLNKKGSSIDEPFLLIYKPNQFVHSQIAFFPVQPGILP